MGVQEDLDGLNNIYRLKSTYRTGTVGGRNESTAEHTWGCLMVAELLLDKVEEPLDRNKVFNILLYHDLVEAECGDVSLDPNVDRSKKHEIEHKAAVKLREELPEPIGKHFYTFFMEFEEQKSREAKFAKLVDGFESDTFTRNSDLEWNGWTVAYHNQKRKKYFDEFPELEEYYIELQSQLIKSGVLSD